MKDSNFTILLACGALVLGGAIGLAFGSIQNNALSRNKKLQQVGNYVSGWSIMPGSMRRVAFLIMALALVQIACPIFFERDGMQWLISGGVVLGYGWTLLDQIRLRSTRQF